jgi:hypothetical protein
MFDDDFMAEQGIGEEREWGVKPDDVDGLREVHREACFAAPSVCLHPSSELA